MFKRSDGIKSVEEFSQFRAALQDAVSPELTEESPVPQPFSYEALPDDHKLGFTDTVMMHAGMGLSQAGEIIGIEAPATLDQLHRRGEIFMYATLGATALFAVVETSGQMF